MAVLISDSRNPAYDGNFETTNAWYEVPTYFLGGSDSTQNVTSGVRSRAFTVASNYTAIGASAFLLSNEAENINTAQHGSLALDIQESRAVTVTIATPAVFTSVGHGMVAGDRVYLTTTGALPTNLTNWTNPTVAPYYVISAGLTADTFRLSLTSEGTAINTSGTQSGTHTLWIIRASKTRTVAEMYGNRQYYSTWAGYHAFEFDTPVNLVTTGSYRMVVRNVGGSTAYPSYWFASNQNVGTNVCCFVWSNIQRTFTSGVDTPIFYKKVTQTTSQSFKGVPFDSALTRAVSGLHVANPSDVYNWYIPSSISSPITVTIDGFFLESCMSGHQFGTSEANPIGDGTQKMLTIIYKRLVTSPSLPFLSCFCSASINNGAAVAYRKEYSYEPPKATWITELSANANAAQKVINVDTDILNVNDTVYVGGYAPGETLTYYTVASKVGTQVTFSTNIGTNRLKGGMVIKQNTNHGIEHIYDDYSVAIANHPSAYQTYYVCEMSGVKFGPAPKNQALNSGNYDMEFYSPNLARSKQVWKNMFFWNSATMRAHYSMPFGAPFVEEKGLLIEGCVLVGYSGANGTARFLYQQPRRQAGATFKSGTFEIKNNIFGYATVAWNYNMATLLTCENWDNRYECNNQSLEVAGLNTTVKDNTFIGVGNVYGNTAGVAIRNSVNPAMSGNTYAGCWKAVSFWDAATSVNPTFKNETFGTYLGSSIPNIIDIGCGADHYTDALFQDCTGNLTFDTAGTYARFPTNAIIGSRFSFTNVNNVDKNDFVYFQTGKTIRCGDGLADTTKFFDTYSVRFEPQQAWDTREEWVQRYTVENIQNKPMMVGIWVNIPSASYWAGVHEMPRLTVNYDNGTTVYAEAAKVTGNQFIFAPFTSLTTYGEIIVTMSGKTDATTANGKFYVGNTTILLPQGHKVEPGKMNTWAKGLPASGISTVSTATDVWAADPTQFGSGTVGAKVNKIKSIVTGLQ